ncbi:aldehyde:ferredoxin oxidoreductase [Humidesulfovibrio mexicanus]|uniref:Aldehyde:ferredoxin oxidoreductase n=1 Tax=Humidesulfovibrio mexicanus TaxID=147047 RepID=A0A239A0T0_9BACT|nr:aldehyde ferredoxin oxidoreductase N-terminal domain-containing protein [Humidesulfovibrio mexicanus]SNR89012.1 aldehyde:ferredoxin oxidoreductase [Humidesulfovibrio mexicanus]
MIRPHFRVVIVDLSARKTRVENLPGREQWLGGSGLAALCFEKYGDPALPWNDPAQPLIFAIGPLTGYFPLMSKTVCAFLSPYHGQYAESHAGGRSALALRFADMDALVVVGRAERPCVLSIGHKHMEIKDAPFLWGKDVFTTGKMLRNMLSGSGTRSILRIGPAGENGCAYACINVDTYRHFGRLGAGAVMGAKNLKAIAIQGDASFPLPEGKAYAQAFKDIYALLTETSMMSKYHDLGTAGNMAALNELKSLPWRNLQATTDPGIEGISGERFAKDMLLRNTACAGCPVGCIHIGFLREKFMADNRYLYRQVAYDYEPIFSLGSMLGMTDGFAVLGLMDAVEREGLDCMSGGVALAWATEALQKGHISLAETLTPLQFGDAEGYKAAIGHLGRGTNEFYRRLAQGTMKAASHYNGQDYACVLGQEMAGYATGETFFVSESLSFRHSHLDSSAYSADQKPQDKDAEKVASGFVKDEASRIVLTSMVGCLFARGVYTTERLQQALGSLGYEDAAANLEPAGQAIQRLRWRLRMRSGYDPVHAKIPKRYTEVVTWKGPIDAEYMETLRQTYAAKLVELGSESQPG